MTRKRAKAPLPDMDAMMELVQRFEAAQAKDNVLARAELKDVLRLVPGKRAIFSGRYGQTPAVFRFYLDEPEAHSRRDWAELQRTAPYMTDGDYRVNAPLHHTPEIGLLIVEHVRGTPLMEYVWNAEHADRARYLQPAAAWFRAYTAPTEARVPERAASWLTRAEKRLSLLPYRKLRPVKSAILAELHRIAAPHDKATWRVAVGHGDFHPNNLLVDGARLTGIDTGGSAPMPIYKDMARFLSHMGRRGLIPSGQERFAVDAAGFDAFATAFQLDETERTVWLPFMIGIEALIRVESKLLSKSRIRRSRVFCETLLEQLRALPD